MRKILLRAWYEKKTVWWLVPFLPLESLYKWIVRTRRYFYGLFVPPLPTIPVLVVGNITLGGSGKTPTVIALANILMKKGLNVGIIGRGYKGSEAYKGMRVFPQSDFNLCGDEAVLLARRTNCPVFVCSDRNKAIRLLQTEQSVDLIISDDGLQHYALPRNMEIAVMDAKTGVGNGHCLPVGPLREPLVRLSQTDLLLINRINKDSTQQEEWEKQISHPCRAALCLRDISLRNLNTAATLAKALWKKRYGKKEVHAVAAIAHPENFFSLLRKEGFRIIPHSFADHYAFRRQDLSFAESEPILMTEKDAIRCETYKDLNIWVVELDTFIDGDIVPLLLANLNGR